MPRPGGEADKIGNQYEGIWTVDCALDVFVGKAASITVEAFGEISEGVEFHLLLFLQGDPSSGFSSVGELYETYWNRKQQNLKQYLGRDSSIVLLS